MQLKHLFLHRLPGFKHRGFSLKELSPHINLIVGPNASGKTSICQAVQKLLWIDKKKGYTPCSIDSEWEHEGRTFTISVEDEVRRVSQNGQEVLGRLPHDSMASCYFLSLDELFDGRDQEFAKKMAKEMSGGYDIEGARRNLITQPNARSAIKEWKEAKGAFEEYRRGQRHLEREKESLPLLEEAIAEAKKAKERVVELRKRLEADKLKAFTPWIDVEVSDEEMARQGDLLREIRELISERDRRLRPAMQELEVAVEYHCRFFGIIEKEMLNSLSLENLDSVEELWEKLEQIKGKMEGIVEQIGLYQTDATEDILLAAKDLLLKLMQFSSVPVWVRFLLFPWVYFMIDRPKKKLIREYEGLMGTSPDVRDLQRILENLNQIERSKGLQARLSEKKEELQAAERDLLDQGRKIGLTFFPTTSRYRFTGYIKHLHEAFVNLRRKERELKVCDERLQESFSKWNHFAALFGEARSEDLYDLERSYERLKEKRAGAQALRELNISPMDMNPEALRDLLEQEEKKAEALLELHGKREVLKSQLAQMEASHEGERLLKEEALQFERVKGAARSFAENEFLDLLIRKTQETFKRDSEPKVLERASDWFCRFTKHAFVLEVSRGSLMYEAVQTATSERKHLEELSRGTRIQLLMAVRLAFALENEGSEAKPPLFFDEVLANTDPDRFQAIADVLDELVKEGRQIFYCSCNQGEAYFWKEKGAHLIDLGEIQKAQAFFSQPLLEAKKEELLPPSDLSLKSYAMTLQIPAFNIREPLELASSYYLIETPEALYQLHLRGLLTYGQIASLKPAYLEKGLPEYVETIRRRQSILETFYRLKKQGRGEKLTLADLEESGLSKKRIEAVWLMALECDLDAKALMEILEKREDARSKGLHQKTVAELREIFIDKGRLDERPLLTDEAIRGEMLPLIHEEGSCRLLDDLLLSAKV